MREPETIRDDELKRFRAGDREAFTAVYSAHYPAVFRFALHMTADSQKAAETAQDVFVWLIHHAEDYDPARGSLGAFLTGVARKFLQRRRYKEQRWVPFDETLADRDRRPEGPEPDTSDADRLRAAIAALPERYREVVALCDLEGKSYEEAAAALECAVGTVRSRLHRARDLLARKLQRKPEESKCEVRMTWSK